MNVELSDISDSDKLSSIVIMLPQAEAEASEYTTLVGFAVTGRMGIRSIQISNIIPPELQLFNGFLA